MKLRHLFELELKYGQTLDHLGWLFLSGDNLEG